MRPLHPIFRRDNPRRPLDWRWQLASHLIETANGRLTRRHYDPTVKLAIRFQRGLAQDASDAGRLNLLDVAPDLYEAWVLYQDTTSRGVRYEIEARLLARESQQDIASKVSYNEETIRLYEACFFHVSDRLHSPGYVTHCVLGRSIQNGLQARDYDCLWKMYGYWGGPMMLDMMIYQFNRPVQPNSAQEVINFLDADTVASLRMKSAVSVRTLPVIPETAIEILNLYMKLLELENNSDKASGAANSMITNIQVFAQNLPWLKQDEADLAHPSNITEQADAMGVRLRAKELVLAGQGHPPLEMMSLLATASYPEKEKKNA